MNDLNLSQRVKGLRNQRGMTQELLAEDSGLSLRTIQRIENAETVPRGDSLKRLAIALNTTPDEIIDWKIQEDKGYLILMSLSALGFLFFPILGIILPLVFWILKKDKLKNVNELGKSMLNFEITWSIVLFSYSILLFLGVISPIFKHITPFSVFKAYVPIIILYIYNFTIIIINTVRVSNGKKYNYIPSLRIFK
ncbi:anaerobic benzoate catabolism transcriptional regulator [Mariniflexile rhizosphaerae]|uniref:helix-turn-helix domain-containing protein n=1 Tax=unclassified Mariniflexile TaxID=2643887 RepID=UPI000CAC8B96|nr:helix-turn-helix domain-containing protein [Mariniflexile sp. TRM1-10]AXP81270.1 anaerobic benzoate catabolism transcriptional regulator [Mariniflexile sp. TRM1-10]PLB18116.1 MAG: Helix-turn-helix domain protein [Flavobacteriaceae bacterium FS1-H7996/R]